MNQNRQLLTFMIVGAMICVFAGVVVWWLQASPGMVVEPRLTDVEAETAAGTMGDGSGASQPADIEGEFKEFDGVPGDSTAVWPRFRGTDVSNVAKDSVALADSWGEGGPEVLWKVELGDGYAGAAVFDGRVFVLDYDEEEESDALRCFSLEDGEEIWRRWYRSPTKKNHGMSRTVPTVTENYVVTVGPKCHVMCVDTETGDFRWGIDLEVEYGSKVPLWYTGQCPLVDGHTAVIAPSGKEVLMMGVDCETGEVVWETPNTHGWDMSHSSVIPMTLLGKKMYVYCAVGGVVGVSAEEADRGKVLWETTAWNHKVIAPSPVAVGNDRIFLAAGYGGGSMMLGLKEEGGAIVAEPRFTLEKTVFGSEQQSPIYYEGHLFGILPKDGGELKAQFVCMDEEGKIVWSSGKTERFGLGPYLFADGKIFILNDLGTLTLARASLEKFEQLDRAEIFHGHDAWAPMALIDGKLLLRDFGQLACIDVSAP